MLLPHNVVTITGRGRQLTGDGRVRGMAEIAQIRESGTKTINVR